MPRLATSFVVTLFSGICACMPLHHTRNAPNSERDENKVTFELKYDPLWQTPMQGLQTGVQIALEITNHENIPIRFPVMDKLSVFLVSSNGDTLMMEGGQDVLIPGKPISDPIRPGNTFRIDLDSRLSWRTDNQLELVLKDGFGSSWQIGPLKPGRYMLHMNYENQVTTDNQTSEIWSGKAKIAPVSLEIMN